jgi:hypothetical protein
MQNIKSIAIALFAGVAAAALVVAPGPAGAGTIVGGSALLGAGDVTQLETWLGEGPLTLTNIYTKASGDTAADFHAAADGQGRTFSIIEVLSGTNTDGTAYASGTQIIGGYNPLSWDGHNHYHLTPDVADMTGFIFNLTQTLFREQVSQYQTYNRSTYGPTFGGGHDIYAGNNLSSGYTYSYSYCDVGTVTKSATATCQFSQNSILNESYYTLNLTYGKIEVFTISAAATIPEPAALAIFGLGLAGLGAMRRRRAA